MSTYQQVQDRINNDYLNRGDFTSETQRAIKQAIRHYERRHWWFNETASALTTVVAQVFVNFPSNLLWVDRVQLTVNNQDLRLSRRDPAWIELANVARTQGQPTDYCIKQNRLEFFPTPNSAWALPCHYIKKLTELNAATDTNAWTSDATEDLVVYHATKLMWANVLRNQQMASTYAALEQSALMEVQSYNEQFYVNAIKATSF